MPPTIAQLDAFVSSSAYDAQTAGLIASMIPAFKADGELISPGVRRIRGNLCNVHGKYGPCDKALSGKKPKGGKRAPRGKKPAKPKVTTEQRDQADTNRSAVYDKLGVSDAAITAINALEAGDQPANADELIAQGLAARGQDGAVRMTAAGRQFSHAADRGDAGAARDAISAGTDQHAARTTRQSAAQARAADVAKRRQDAVGKRIAAQIGAAFPKRKPAKAKPAKAKPEPAAAKPARAAFTPPPPRRGTASASTGGGSGGGARPKPPAPIKAPAPPTKAPPKKLAPALTEAATALSEGADVTDAQVLDLVRNGLVKLNKDGTPVLTAAGQRATMKDYAIDIYAMQTWVAQRTTTKAQTAQDKAMFAKMGGGGSGGSGGKGSAGGGSKLWPKGPNGKRTPQAAAAETRGKPAGGATPKSNPKERGGASSILARRQDAANQQARDDEHNHRQDVQIQKRNAALQIAQRDRAALQTSLDRGTHNGKKLTPEQRARGEAEVARQDRIITRAERDIQKLNSATKSADGTLRVFKDAHGEHRWVAISSCAFEDRDHEVVSTKALQDDCDFADKTGSYGPLRWWHMPNVDIGDCDFNAMEGRMLIEMGTFRNPAIAVAVHKAAADLELSIGFLHLPSEPDADRVFHHIRRFERSLVPRGKASNRFTQLMVKETSMFDTKEKEAIEKLGSSPEALAYMQDVIAAAASRQKSAEAEGVRHKADEPEEIYFDAQSQPGIIRDGQWLALKAFPPKADAAPMPDNAEEDALDGGADDAEEEAPADENALTLSAGDMAAIGELINGAITQIMGGLNLEKKVADHVQGLLAPMATKEATLTTQVAELTTQIKELTGDQPSAPYRATGARDTLLTDAAMLAAVKQATDQNNNDPWADIKVGLGIQRST